MFSVNSFFLALQRLNSEYPEQTALDIAGYSVEKRPVYRLQIGRSGAPKAIFIHVAIHGREWLNSWVVLDIIRDYLSHWDHYEPLFHDWNIHILPMANPDGVAISQERIPRWKANAHGVDLNRNFATCWRPGESDGETDTPESNGTGPMSEPETQTIAKALNERHFDMALSIHSSESIIYWDVMQEEGPLRDECQRLGEIASRVTGYPIGDVGIPRGLDYNYSILDCHIPTVLIETGEGVAPLDPALEYQPIYQKLYELLPTLILNTQK